jgi:hypothetical protein
LPLDVNAHLTLALQLPRHSDSIKRPASKPSIDLSTLPTFMNYCTR